MPSAVNQGGCPCGSTVECVPSFNVTLCSDVIEGATVKIWDSDAKTTLMGSGASDALGYAEVSINVPLGVVTNWYWEASHPSDRVGVASGESFCNDDGTPDFTIDADLPPATDYWCNPWCQLPLYKTLYYHDDVLGDVTLTNTTGAWVGTVSHSFPSGTDGNGNTCGGPTVNVTVSAGGAAPPNSVTVAMPRGGAIGASECSKCILASGTDTPCAATDTLVGCPDSDGFALTLSYAAGVLNPTSPAVVSGSLTE